MVVSLAACGGSSDKKSDKKDDGKAEVNLDDTKIEVCIASEPDTIDPALNSAVDGATMLVHLFSGLAKWAQNDDGKLEIVPDAAEELTEGVKNDDGTVTYTYTLRDGLKWSDGKDVSAKDFEFAWKRASSLETASDYGYMFEVVDGYADIVAVDDAGNPVNPDAQLKTTRLWSLLWQTTFLTGTSCSRSRYTSRSARTLSRTSPGQPILPPMSATVCTSWKAGIMIL